MKHKITALLLVITVIIAIAVGAIIFNKSHELMATAGKSLAAELSQLLGSQVSIGELEVGTFNNVTVYNAAIYDKSSRPVMSSSKITVTFNLLKILGGAAAVDSINNITVAEPEIILDRNADGHWNIEDILQNTETQKQNFSGKVILVKGKAVISAPEGSWTANDINGTLDFVHKTSTDVNLAAVFQGTEVKAAGTVNFQANGLLNIQADKLDVADYPVLSSLQPSLHLAGGSVKNIDVTLRRDQGKLEYSGAAGFDNFAFDANGFPVREAQGFVTFTNSNIYLLGVTAKVAEQPVRASGKITVGTDDPALDVAVSSSGFDPGVLKAGIPLTGPVAFNVNVTGKLANPVVNGDLRLQQGEVSGYGITEAKASIYMADKVVTIREFQGNILGGQIVASGQVGLEPQLYRLTVKGQNIDTASIRDVVPEIKGRGNFEVTVDGQGPVSAASVSGMATLSDGEVDGVPFKLLNGGFYRVNGQTTIDYLNISLSQGTVTASGVVYDDGALHVDVRGYNVPLSLLAQRVNGMILDGSADFDGIITGSIASPQLAASFTAANGQAFYQPFAQASGNIVVTPENIELKEMELTDGPTSHKLHGTIGLKGSHEIKAVIVSHHARAENIVKLLAPGEKLTGNVDNDITLSGNLANLNAEGHLKLTEGSFRGQLIARGEGSYQRNNGVTTIRDFVVDSLNTQVKLSGVIAANNELDFDVSATDIDTGKLHLDFPYPIAGQANFAGKLSGTVQEPVFSGELSAKSLMFNGQKLSSVTGSLSIHGNSIDIYDCGFEQGGGKFSFSGGLDIASKDIYGNIDVEKGELAFLLAIVNMPVNGVEGQLNGHVNLSGLVSKPDISVIGNLTKGKIKNYPLDNVDIDVAMQNNIITVNKFSARQGNGVLAVQGTADLNGPLNVEVGGRDIDAGLLTAWFDLGAETKGKLSFGAQISGTAANPHAAVSLEIDGGGLGDATFDKLYGLFIYDNKRINVNQVLISKGPYRASAYGVVPVAAINTEGRRHASAADEMNLNVHLDEADLSILPLLTKQVSWAAGKTQGEINISGTLVEPSLQGSILVNDGTVKFAWLSEPIQKVAIDIQFQGDKININAFDGHMGSGSYHLSGGASLDGMALKDYNMALVMDTLGVNSKYFKGPLNGTLKLTDEGGKPKLSGKLVFDHDTVDIPFIPLTDSNYNIALDIEVAVGNKVHLYNPYMYDLWTAGHVKFGGTTKEPDVSGRIRVVRGTVSYLRTSFKVQDGSAEFTRFGSFEPVIKLSAETQLENTTVKLAVNGPVSAMDVKLTSEPAMSQQEILSLLTLRSRYFEKQNSGNGADTGLGRDEIVGLLNAGLQMRFLSEVEGAFRNAFGLDEFRLVQGTLSSNTPINSSKSNQETYGGQEVYNLEISKYITDRLMLSYSVGVDNSQHSMSARYDINRHTSITGSIDEQNNSRIGIETRFRF